MLFGRHFARALCYNELTFHQDQEKAMYVVHCLLVVATINLIEYYRRISESVQFLYLIFGSQPAICW